MSIEPIVKGTISKWAKVRRATTADQTFARADSGNVVELASAIYKRDIRKIASLPGTTTDAILQDPVWRTRLRASLQEASKGKTRSSTDYWAEVDAGER